MSKAAIQTLQDAKNLVGPELQRQLQKQIDELIRAQRSLSPLNKLTTELQGAIESFVTDVDKLTTERIDTKQVSLTALRLFNVLGPELGFAPLDIDNAETSAPVPLTTKTATPEFSVATVTAKLTAPAPVVSDDDDNGESTELSSDRSLAPAFAPPSLPSTTFAARRVTSLKDLSDGLTDKLRQYFTGQKIRTLVRYTTTTLQTLGFTAAEIAELDAVLKANGLRRAIS